MSLLPFFQSKKSALITPPSRLIIDQLIVAHFVNELFVFYGMRGLVTVLRILLDLFNESGRKQPKRAES
jgi:hypothetical protein